MNVVKTERTFSGEKFEFLVRKKHNARYHDRFDRDSGPFRKKLLPTITFERIVQKRHFDILTQNTVAIITRDNGNASFSATRLA